MPNRLALEKSPYLLQHKDNPVDWHPWGPEAFAKAKAEGKPILLSIGYSTCHWCHVMERESFEDPAVAAVMNAHFVCVKLDREERPDVDKVYMAAVQATTGRGGWPLNCFLTPDLKPFFGGTYFPPQARWGQPGWTAILERVAALWREKRPELEADAAKIHEAILAFVSGAQEEGAPKRPDPAILDKAVGSLKAAFDPRHAGFGGAPKFPMPAYQRLLLRRHARMGDETPKELAVATLRAMARGGIFDQAGGGLHRYSTDEAWILPHFEKMLYDNAQFVENLADALALGPDPVLARALDSTIGYLERDLRHPEGGFYSAEDADSGAGKHKEEGAFYVWTAAELDRVLGPAAAPFRARFAVEENGNAPMDPHGEFAGKSILYDRDPAAMPDADAAAALSKLLEARASRPRPSLDDKVLASWNGLAIAGLARAHAVTGDPRPLKLAREAAAFVRAKMYDPKTRSLTHRWRDGEGAVAGMADDYAFLINGLLELYEAGFDPAHLSWALELAEEALKRFALPDGGLRLTAEGAAPELPPLIVDDHDGVEPAAASVLCEAALRLDALCGRAPLRAFAEKTLERFGARLEARPMAMPYLLCALDRALGEGRTLVIAGLDLPGGAEMLAEARRTLRPGLSLAAFASSGQEALAPLVPGVSAMELGKSARAYLCRDGACGIPFSGAGALRTALESA